MPSHEQIRNNGHSSPVFDEIMSLFACFIQSWRYAQMIYVYMETVVSCIVVDVILDTLATYAIQVTTGIPNLFII